MRLSLIVLLLCSTAVAQDLNPAQRTAAVARLHELADCVHQRDRDLQEILRLLAQAERQQQSSDATLRRDADHTVEALIARAHDAQERLQACTRGELPSPGTQIVEREPPADQSADRVAQSTSGLRTIEENQPLASHIQVVRGEQVDGRGQLPASAVRDAVHGIATRLSQCYDAYLDHGSADPHQLDLVFTVPATSGVVRDVQIDRSELGDAQFDACVRRAAQQIRVSRAPAGGDATYGYAFRFGR